jgi:uncharacterized membrane protein
MAKTPQSPSVKSSSETAETGRSAAALTVANEIRERVEETIGPLVPGGQARVQVVERVTQMMSAEIFRGPIPHPKHIQGYEDACPGAADRIIRMAEVAQTRLEDRRDTVIENEYSDRRLGMYLGFGALIAMVIGGVILVYHGEKEIGGTLLGAGVLGSIVKSFIHGRQPQTGEPSDEPSVPSPDKSKT